jgi:hypothetical protein
MTCAVCDKPTRNHYGGICRKCKTQLKRERAARIAELPWYIVPDRNEDLAGGKKEKRIFSPTRIPTTSRKHTI